MLQISEVIARARLYFHEITGKSSVVFGDVSPAEFKKKLDERFNVKTDNQEVLRFLRQMDYDQRGLMNLFSWNGLIDMNTLVGDLFRVPNLRSGSLEPIIRALSDEEEEMFKNMMRRVHTIARVATERDVRVLVDAEQTYFQPAINRITLELMRKYNKEKAIIFNTYQCYLKVRRLLFVATNQSNLMFATIERPRELSDRCRAVASAEFLLWRQVGARRLHGPGEVARQPAGLRGSDQRELRGHHRDV